MWRSRLALSTMPCSFLYAKPPSVATTCDLASSLVSRLYSSPPSTMSYLRHTQPAGAQDEGRGAEHAPAGALGLIVARACVQPNVQRWKHCCLPQRSREAPAPCARALTRAGCRGW
jgi:hypothetical protein